MQQSAVLTVSALTRQIKGLLEDSFDEVCVTGELSNFKSHYGSGHWYFSLKDADAQISGVMWRSYTNFVFFTPQDGMKVVIRGKLSVYPPRGTYQLDARSMQPAGAGELQVAFDALKKKLGDEGLFDESHKRPLPVMPEKIGIATAIDSAAMQDMLSVARRRFPLAELVVVPCRVQGSGAAETVAEAIAMLNRHPGVEVIIVARGGGSIEDLWAFNEELTARAIYDSPLPVVTGIGHETDFTIADFVSDFRAPTPTAAMETITPDAADLRGLLEQYQTDLGSDLRRSLARRRADVLALVGPSFLRRPMQLIRQYSQELDYGSYRLHERMKQVLLQWRNLVEKKELALQRHDVNAVLKKGFVLVTQHGKFVKRASGLTKNEIIKLRFYDNTIELNGNEEDKGTDI